MRLTAIDVHDVRSIRQASLEPAPGINLVVGANGAGKTALLEAIHVLATGRSFAVTRTGRLIRDGAGPLRVVARAQAGDGGRVHRFGIERDGSGVARMRRDGAPVARVADLARNLPIVPIHPQSHALIAGGPNERRRFLDQGLFHVEPDIHAAWQRYRRALSQRNVLLRRGAAQSLVQPFEEELARTGTRIDELRQRHVASLEAALQEIAPRLFVEADALEVAYRRGWDEARSLQQALADLRGRALDQRVAGVGPHRADLVVRRAGQDVRQRVSRGQQKLLVYGLRLAQVLQWGRSGIGDCILLLDDLPAELDHGHRQRVMAITRSLGVQCFVTAIEAAEIPRLDAPPRTFHMEQGTLRELV